MNSNNELLCNKYLHLLLLINNNNNSSSSSNNAQQLVSVEINKDVVVLKLIDNDKMNKVFFLDSCLQFGDGFIYLDYYTAQRQMAAQRGHQQEEQSSHPVGIQVCFHLQYDVIFGKTFSLESYE